MLASLFVWMIFLYSCVLVSKKASIYVWLLSYSIFTILLLKYNFAAFFVNAFFSGFLIVLVLLAVQPLRKWLVSGLIFKIVSKFVPKMSTTEREALEAGTVSWEAELFSGEPDFARLFAAKPGKISAREQRFLDGPVNELCRMLDDWEVTHKNVDLPKEAWEFIKKNGFLGMIIPKKYGGLEFSTTAQMMVLVKLYSCSITAATTVSVPNSLGPAELLLNYGTKEQKEYYLPRLAKGEEIPCFALTGPNAGSDAASIPDTGVVCYKTINGEKVLGMSLTWDKRYITLCPVATIIGLAFRMFDPDNILGKGEDLGISCALIPADTQGVIRGRRHFPLNSAFMNGPTQGTDVFVSLDCLIGGKEMVGHGWRMLMECLSAGRAISLPSGACGSAKAAALTSGAYARIRTQFHQSIANFEGIEEPLARIAGNTYIINAMLTRIAAYIDEGAKPPVASAIVKYHTTELSRQIACDAMDIHGGKGICLGPNNYLGRAFESCPISITVEGANILSRSLIIFGQGVIRCHPYIFSEMEALRNNDLTKFDKAFCGHFRFAIANLFNSILFTFTDGRTLKYSNDSLGRFYQLVRMYSVILASFSDLAMMLLGGELKRKEKLSSRFGDILSYLYQVSAVLKRFHEDGCPDDDLPVVKWCAEKLFFKCEDALYEIIVNFPIRWLRWVFRFIYIPYGRIRKKPSDNLGKQLAKLLSTPSKMRERLTHNVFAEDIDVCPVGKVEAAFKKVVQVQDLEKKVHHALKEGKIKSLTFIAQIHDAKTLKIINDKEYKLLLESEEARQNVIAVDSFTFQELQRKE